MKNLEEIERTRCFLEKLANGVNSLTGEVAADTDLIRNAEISPRLSYVVDVLSQVIDSGDLPPARRGAVKGVKPRSPEELRVFRPPHPCQRNCKTDSPAAGGPADGQAALPIH